MAGRSREEERSDGARQPGQSSSPRRKKSTGEGPRHWEIKAILAENNWSPTERSWARQKTPPRLLGGRRQTPRHGSSPTRRRIIRSG